MNKVIIISQPWGGLGDNLQFSTLPELFHNKGCHVYISENNQVRNHEIFDLVWKQNPYIKGIITDSEGMLVGSSMQDKWPPESQNEYFMHRVEIAHGFTGTNFYPKIYYNPSYIPELSNNIIIDLTGSSQVYNIEKYVEYIDFFVPLIENKNKQIKVLYFEKINPVKIFEEVYKYLEQKIKHIEYLKINSLIHYCDVIKSCDTLIIVNSGINSLSSAIKKDNITPNILCYNPWSHFTPQALKGFYCYKNVEYFQSKI